MSPLIFSGFDFLHPETTRNSSIRLTIWHVGVILELQKQVSAVPRLYKPARRGL
jgi:hypothetical protein